MNSLSAYCVVLTVYCSSALAQAQNIPDSSALRLLDTEIAAAEAEVRGTDFWHRLIPRVTLSASFGMRELVFVDPAESTPWVLPKDAYSLHVSLSLTDLFSSAKQREAEVKLERLMAEKEKFVARQRAAERELLLLKEQLEVLQSILRFKQMLFGQGKAQYDEVERVKMEKLTLLRAVNRLRLEQNAQAP